MTNAIVEFFISNQDYISKIAVLTALMGILVIGNIAGRVYYNLEKKKELFEMGRFLNGIFKAILIMVMIVALTLSYISFVHIDMIKKDMVDPMIICYTGAAYYFITLTNTLIAILGIKIEPEKYVEPKEEISVIEEPEIIDEPIIEEEEEEVEKEPKDTFEIIEHTPGG